VKIECRREYGLASRAACGQRPQTCSAGHREDLPYLSWISAPHSLIDAEDTLDKIEKEKLAPVARSVREVVKQLMMLP
jgi:hypothetical protein